MVDESVIEAAPSSQAAGATIDLAFESDGGSAVWLRAVVPASRLGLQPLAVPLPACGSIIVGSGPDADLRLPDPYVSGRHCRVARAGALVEVVDLGSRNGVRVGAARVERAHLSVGGSFELGRSVVHVDASEPSPESEAEPLRQLVGTSRAMRRLAAAVRRAAPLRLPVLIRGDSGTGKELVARALHDEGPRTAGPFVAINAATVARDLAESELFGHLRGAFTGALRDRRGAFREAHQGTLFLDEIGALPLDVQAKLLRAVEEGVVRPLGAEAGCSVDVRLVAATCEPLERMVIERAFRGDLYERLAVCVIRVPPLRERLDDVPALASHLLAASEFGGREITRGALSVLRSQAWPGNVRELRNVIVQAALRARSAIRADHVAAVLAERAPAARRRLRPGDALQIFEEAGRNVSAAARRADLPRTTMRDLLRAAGVPPARGARRR